MCVIFLFCFSRGNTLTPYSKSVPAVIAKASAIYNPIIYAIIHPRYRYSKHIGMCITVHANVFFTMKNLPPFSQPPPMWCTFPPWPLPDGIHVVRPCTASTLYRAAQAACGAPDMASGVVNRGEQSLPSPYFSLTTLLCPLELHNTMTGRKRRWCSGSSFAVSGRAAKEHSSDNSSQPARLKNHVITNLRSYICICSKVWFSEALKLCFLHQLQ